MSDKTVISQEFSEAFKSGKVSKVTRILLSFKGPQFCKRTEHYLGFVVTHKMRGAKKSDFEKLFKDLREKFYDSELANPSTDIFGRCWPMFLVPEVRPEQLSAYVEVGFRRLIRREQDWRVVRRDTRQLLTSIWSSKATKLAERDKKTITIAVCTMVAPKGMSNFLFKLLFAGAPLAAVKSYLAAVKSYLDVESHALLQSTDTGFHSISAIELLAAVTSPQSLSEDECSVCELVVENSPNIQTSQKAFRYAINTQLRALIINKYCKLGQHRQFFAEAEEAAHTHESEPTNDSNKRQRLS